MHHAIAVALGVAVGTALVSFLVSHRVRPEVAARAIATLAVLSAAATLWMLLLVAAASVVQLHGIAERLSWCSNVVIAHRDTLSPWGGASIAALAGLVYSAVRVRRRQRCLRSSGRGELTVVASEIPTAFALPGRPGQIVVSTGMLQSLEPDECRVLIAHERAHLRCRHHRYVRLTELASAAMPILAPLNHRVRYATERWADEEAVREVGDRAVVARAIARAAIAQTDGSGPGLGIADTGVLARVESLLTEAPQSSQFSEIGLLGAIVAAAAGLMVSLALVEPWVAHLVGLCH